MVTVTLYYISKTSRIFLSFKVTPDALLKFFTQVGEVKYVRMAGDVTVRFAFIEFTDQRSVATAMTYNGVMFQGNPIT